MLKLTAKNFRQMKQTMSEINIKTHSEMIKVLSPGFGLMTKF